MLDTGQNLLYISHSNLTFSPGSFRQIYANEFGKYLCPVDRFGLLKQIGINDPFEFVNIIPWVKFDLNNLTSDWWDRYVNTFDMVADNVYNTAKDRKIAVLYSGGIDSTAMLISLIKHPSYQEFVASNRFYLALTTPTAILENSEFFYTELLGTVPMVTADYNQLMLDDTSLVVTALGGNGIIGCSGSLRYIPTLVDFLHLPVTDIAPYTELNRRDPSRLLTKIVASTKVYCPFDVESLNQLFWWVNQCFALQNKLCNPYVWSNASDLSKLNSHEKVYKFYMDPEWFTFSYEYMSTNPKYTNLDSLQNYPKKYITDYTGNNNYLKTPIILDERILYKSQTKTRIYSDLSYKFDDIKITT